MKEPVKPDRGTPDNRGQTALVPPPGVTLATLCPVDSVSDRPRVLCRDMGGFGLALALLGALGWFASSVDAVLGGGHGDLLIWTAAAVLGVLVVWEVWKSPQLRRWRRGAAPPSQIPALASPGARVVATGDPLVLADRMERVESGSFEPYIVRGRFAVRAERLWIAMVLALGGLGVTALGVWFFGPRQSGGIVPPVGVFEIVGAVAVGMFLQAFWEPTYFRVSPGRLDILTYTLGRGGRPGVVRLDLRTEHVVLDCDKHVLFLRTAQPLRSVQFASVPDVAGLESAILSAAVSVHPGPELPDDVLTG